MAKSRSKKLRIRFELSLTGMLGLSVVAFCIFLWMFLLGVWAGKTVLLPESNRSGPTSGVSELWHEDKEPVAPPAELMDQLVTDVGELIVDPDQVEPSFFSLQVAAYSEAARARKAAAEWRDRGLDAFSLLPVEGGDGLYRVCVGKFENLAEANRESGRLEEAEEIRTFITLVPAAQVQP